VWQLALFQKYRPVGFSCSFHQLDDIRSISATKEGLMHKSFDTGIQFYCPIHVRLSPFNKTHKFFLKLSLSPSFLKIVNAAEIVNNVACLSKIYLR